MTKVLFLDGQHLGTERWIKTRHAIQLIQNPSEEVLRDGLKIEINDAMLAVDFLNKLKTINFAKIAFPLQICFKSIPEFTVNNTASTRVYPYTYGYNEVGGPLLKQSYGHAIAEITYEIIRGLSGQNVLFIEFVLPEHVSWEKRHNPILFYQATRKTEAKQPGKQVIYNEVVQYLQPNLVGIMFGYLYPSFASPSKRLLKSFANCLSSSFFPAAPKQKTPILIEEEPKKASSYEPPKQ